MIFQTFTQAESDSTTGNIASTATGKYQLVADFLIDNQQSLYRLAYSYLKNRDSALDVVQQAAEKALKSSSLLRQPQYVKTWIYRIVVNESLSYLRKNSRCIVCDEMPYEVKTIDPDVAANLTLYQAIDQLPVQLKTIIVLKYFEGFKIEEIATITKTNANTVKTRIRSALAKLKIQLEEV